MREPYREELSQLRETLEEMKDLLKRIQKEDRPYFYRFLDRMKNNIEIGLCLDVDHQIKLDEILLRDWIAANDAYTGIPDYYSSALNLKRNQAAREEFARLAVAIEEYFKQHGGGSICRRF